MSQAYKVCPICDTPNHRNAALCSTCGTTLTNVQVINQLSAGDSIADYAELHGETDLLEGNLHWKGGTYLIGGLVTAILIGCIATLVFVGSRLLNVVMPPTQVQPLAIDRTLTPTSDVGDGVLVTNTARPTLQLATITLGPPTPTYTETPTIAPTQGPCVQQVQPNDSLIAIIARCGHREYKDLMQVVLDMNNLTDPNQIQVGKSVQVPWPTATIDPNAVPTASPISGASSDVGGGTLVADSSVRDSAGVRVRPTETLQADVIWHTVTGQENITNIAIDYGATLRILSELNPEIAFSQCDFGIGSGGPGCTVLLYPGQQVRVPAPTVTPTIQPTASGSETPTPTATPTYNVPTSISPSDKAFFRKDDLVTLRWVGTGALSADEAYLVRVEDLTSKQVFTAMTQGLLFILPAEWQSQKNDRHDYTWSVGVVKQSQPDKPRFVTESRQFTWQGRGNGT